LPKQTSISARLAGNAFTAAPRRRGGAL